jgi:hypothetical protein
MKAECVAFFFTESSALVQPRIQQQISAVQARPHNIVDLCLSWLGFFAHTTSHALNPKTPTAATRNQV